MALLLAGVGACNDSDDKQPNDRNSSRPETPAEASDARAESEQVGDVIVLRTDLFVPKSFATAEGSARSERARAERDRAFQSRCRLWSIYLEQNSNLGRTGEGADDRLGLDRDTENCTGAVDTVEDTGLRDADGNPKQITRSRMQVEIKVPAGRSYEPVVLHRFENLSRYDAWVQCHKAAGRTQDVAFDCVDRGLAADGVTYVSELRAFRPVRTASR